MAYNMNIIYYNIIKKTPYKIIFNYYPRFRYFILIKWILEYIAIKNINLKKDTLLIIGQNRKINSNNSKKELLNFN